MKIKVEYIIFLIIIILILYNICKSNIYEGLDDSDRTKASCTENTKVEGDQCGPPIMPNGENFTGNLCCPESAPICDGQSNADNNWYWGCRREKGGGWDPGFGSNIKRGVVGIDDGSELEVDPNWNNRILNPLDLNTNTDREILYLKGIFDNKEITDVKDLVELMFDGSFNQYNGWVEPGYDRNVEKEGVMNIFPEGDNTIYELKYLWQAIKRINSVLESDGEEGFLIGGYYGLVNLVSFLSTCGVETAHFSVCDEQPNVSDGSGYNDNPSCGLWAPNDQKDEHGNTSTVQGYMGPNYDGHGDLGSANHTCPNISNVDIHAVTYSPWARRDRSEKDGGNGLMECTSEGTPARTDKLNPIRQSVTNGCCWWGRGTVQLTGRRNVGNFNHFIQNCLDKYSVEKSDENNICKNPNLICTDPELRWLSGLFYWVTEVQANENFKQSLYEYVIEDNSNTNPREIWVEEYNRTGCRDDPNRIGHTGCETDLKPNPFSVGCQAVVNQGGWNKNPQDGKQRLLDFCSLMENLKHH